MYRFFLVSTCIISLVLSIPFRLLGQINQYDSILYKTKERTFELHVPSTYNPSNPTPLVIAMHGGGAISWYSLEQSSQLISKSNASGFILVYPEGRMVSGIRTWNGGGCCSYAVSLNVDDVGFINALIDSLNLKYNIDPNRIYATGISNGAIMAYRLACELSSRIAAVAIVSGTLEDTDYTCTPSRPVPIIQFHSTQDTNIPINGGYGSGSSGYSFHSVNYGLQKFANLNSCNSTPDSNKVIVGSNYYYKKHWHSCSCNAEEILYVTSDGGHSWPGGQTGSSPGADPPSTIINANDSIWNFFQAHSLQCMATSVNKSLNLNSSIKLYPNPVHDVITIDCQEEQLQSVKITNLNGKALGEYYQSSIDVSHLPQGLYSISIQLKDRATTLLFNKE
jgi:polyhydroxybutyrate depolymerase